MLHRIFVKYARTEFRKNPKDDLAADITSLRQTDGRTDVFSTRDVFFYIP